MGERRYDPSIDETIMEPSGAGSPRREHSVPNQPTRTSPNRASRSSFGRTRPVLSGASFASSAPSSGASGTGNTNAACFIASGLRQVPGVYVGLGGQVTVKAGSAVNYTWRFSKRLDACWLLSFS